MIKEALHYLVGLGAIRKFTDGNGDTWMDQPMHRIKEYLPAVKHALVVHSLASLIEYVKGQPDNDFALPPSMILVEGPAKVALVNCLDEDGGRDTFILAMCDEPQFQFGHFMEVEPFILAVYSSFLPMIGGGNAFQDMLAIVSSLTAQGENEIKDTGLTQLVTIRQGIDVKQEDIPNPMFLFPYRSFPEIEPVAAPFLLRVKASNGIPQVALFETDGGRWKVEARRRIKTYLVNALGDIVAEQKLTIME